VVKGEVCKTSMQRFESARRLQTLIDFSDHSRAFFAKKNPPVLSTPNESTLPCHSHSSRS
jgi:hypothetical protein